MRPDTVLRLHDFLDFGQLVSIDHDAGIPRMSEYDKEFLLKSSPGIELWKFADQILKELAGRQMTWTELKQHYKINHPDVWNNIVGHAKKFQHVLS